MARSFAGGTDETRWTIAGAPDGIGCIALWIKTTQATTNASALTYWSGSSKSGWGLLLNNTANKITFQGYPGSAGPNINIACTTTVNDGNAHHVAVNYNRNSAGSNQIYIDGVQENSGNSSAGWTTGLTNFSIQSGDNNDAFWASFIGSIWDIGHWFGVQLTADEIVSLAKGFSPKLIRPASRVLYVPATRDPHDIVRAASIPSSGGTVADHGRTMGGAI